MIPYLYFVLLYFSMSFFNFCRIYLCINMHHLLGDNMKSATLYESFAVFWIGSGGGITESRAWLFFVLLPEHPLSSLYRKCSSLKQHPFISSQFCGPEVQCRAGFSVQCLMGWNPDVSWLCSYLETKEESADKLIQLLVEPSSWEYGTEVLFFYGCYLGVTFRSLLCGPSTITCLQQNLSHVKSLPLWISDFPCLWPQDLDLKSSCG